MAVVYKSRSKKAIAFGNASFGLGNYAVPGLFSNKHVTITVPIDENSSMLINLSTEEFEKLKKTVELYSKEVWGS